MSARPLCISDGTPRMNVACARSIALGCEWASLEELDHAVEHFESIPNMGNIDRTYLLMVCREIDSERFSGLRG